MSIQTGPFGDAGARLDIVPDEGQETASCMHHRLHLPFLHCGKAAPFMLTKAHGERVALCEGHAAELLARYDVPDGESPRVADGLDLAWRHPDAVDESALPVSLWDGMEGGGAAPQAADDTFGGGSSGGGGGGGTFNEAPPMTMTASVTSDDAIQEVAAAETSVPDADVPDSAPVDTGMSDTASSTDTGGAANG